VQKKLDLVEELIQEDNSFLFISFFLITKNYINSFKKLISMFPLIRDTLATNYEKSLVVFSQLASLTSNMVREEEIITSLIQLKKPLELYRLYPHNMIYSLRCSGDIFQFDDQHPQRIRARYFRLTEEGLNKVDHAIYKSGLLEQEARDSIATVADEVITKINPHHVFGRHYFGKEENFPALPRYVSFMKPEE
jgi:hypothetical protein